MEIIDATRIDDERPEPTTDADDPGATDRLLNALRASGAEHLAAGVPLTSDEARVMMGLLPLALT